MPEHQLEGAKRRLEPEGLDQDGERPIGRAVVDHDHVVRRVVQREQRADALDDRPLLVEGRHQDRDLGQSVPVVRPEAGGRGLGRANHEFDQGEGEQRGVESVLDHASADHDAHHPAGERFEPPPELGFGRDHAIDPSTARARSPAKIPG